jgi:hypothetical protein
MTDKFEYKRHPYADLYEKLMNNKECMGHGDYRVDPLSIAAANALDELARQVGNQTYRIAELEAALKPVAKWVAPDGLDDGHILMMPFTVADLRAALGEKG